MPKLGALEPVCEWTLEFVRLEEPLIGDRFEKKFGFCVIKLSTAVLNSVVW
jgi:hypothetical protein